MQEHDALVSRLRKLASVRPDETTSDRHLQALAFSPTPGSPPARRRRLVAVGALVTGSLLGGATLAGAVTGNLPDAAQDAAHAALARVGIDVPKGKAVGHAEAQANDEGGPGKVERFLGDETTPCTNPDGSPFVGNHGQYVKAHPDDPATADVNEREEAAHSRCGKPIQAAVDEDGDDTEGVTTEDHGKPEGAGKPDDAGKPEGAGKPESPGKSADHKPDDAGKPDDTPGPSVPEADED